MALTLDFNYLYVLYFPFFLFSCIFYQVVAWDAFVFVSTVSVRFLPVGGWNMVRLAFQRSNFSIYYYVCLFLLSSFLALSAKCTIFFVSNWAFFIVYYRLSLLIMVWLGRQAF